MQDDSSYRFAYSRLARRRNELMACRIRGRKTGGIYDWWDAEIASLTRAMRYFAK